MNLEWDFRMNGYVPTNADPQPVPGTPATAAAGPRKVLIYQRTADRAIPSGYSTSDIPEPSTVVLLLLGLGCVTLLCCSRSWPVREE